MTGLTRCNLVQQRDYSVFEPNVQSRSSLGIRSRTVGQIPWKIALRPRVGGVRRQPQRSVMPPVGRRGELTE